ncbi:SRPBCC family protein [Antrihabitans cavernicola]|uniref:SRPBCC family protein n=1 Tax=Antrihabitans cavernicola TaxID=2495913 RepID=A0A5A7SF16_9NOCA|nr:SRPBCC family protein [Spelaeibacter cavernicola]KAA0022821.1 SRPBCC family protein [Spelaeibacter cavernicola]
MTTITVERTIEAPVADVFDWVATARNYPRSWVVLRERLATPGTEAPYGVGAVRILLWVIGWFRERITAYDAPRSFDYLVERSFPPSRHEGGRIEFTEVPGGTHVVWTTTGIVALPIGGAFVMRVIAKPFIVFVFGRILDRAARELTQQKR